MCRQVRWYGPGWVPAAIVTHLSFDHTSFSDGGVGCKHCRHACILSSSFSVCVCVCVVYVCVCIHVPVCCAMQRDINYGPRSSATVMIGLCRPLNHRLATVACRPLSGYTYVCCVEVELISCCSRICGLFNILFWNSSVCVNWMVSCLSKTKYKYLH